MSPILFAILVLYVIFRIAFIYRYRNNDKIKGRK